MRLTGGLESILLKTAKVLPSSAKCCTFSPTTWTDSLSENQLPSVSPDLSTSSLACYASNQSCSRTKSGAACAQELGFEI